MALSPFSGMASAKIEAVVRERHRMAECPVWEEEAERHVYMDIHAGSVCRWDPLSGAVQTVGLRDHMVCVALRQSESYMVAASRCLGILDWTTGQVRWLSQLDRDRPNNRFNEGKVDPAGRFVAGTIPEPSSPGVWEHGWGSLYTLYADGLVVRHLDELGISNGLDWSLDQRTSYHADRLEYTVRAYDYDLPTGDIAVVIVSEEEALYVRWVSVDTQNECQKSDTQTVHLAPPSLIAANPHLQLQLQEGDGMPDRMCVDTEGRLWVACIDGGRVIHLDPETGTLLQTVDMPVSRVTSCCFGGPHYSDLYVTSASDGLSAEQLCWETQAGYIFKVTGLGAKGFAGHVHALLQAQRGWASPPGRQWRLHSRVDHKADQLSQSMSASRCLGDSRKPRDLCGGLYPKSSVASCCGLLAPCHLHTVNVFALAKLTPGTGFFPETSLESCLSVHNVCDAGVGFLPGQDVPSSELELDGAFSERWLSSGESYFLTRTQAGGPPEPLGFAG
ncbi:regucalcin-like [Trichechus inunguis]